MKDDRETKDDRRPQTADRRRRTDEQETTDDRRRLTADR